MTTADLALDGFVNKLKSRIPKENRGISHAVNGLTLKRMTR
jgi:hypothetical protein